MSTDQYVEIDSGVERVDGASTLRVQVREADGLRRTLTTFVLDDEQAVNLVRGGAFVTHGTRPAEFDGGDALVDALDHATSGTGKPTDRSPAQIADALIYLLRAGIDGGRLPFGSEQALRRALRGTDLRPDREEKAR